MGVRSELTLLGLHFRTVQYSTVPYAACTVQSINLFSFGKSEIQISEGKETVFHRM